MAEYRLYEIGDGDHIVKVIPLICRDDREAIEIASDLAEGHLIEVWSGERFVTRIVPGE